MTQEWFIWITKSLLFLKASYPSYGAWKGSCTGRAHGEYLTGQQGHLLTSHSPLSPLQPGCALGQGYSTVLQLPGMWECDLPKCHYSTITQAQAMNWFQLLEILFVSGRRMLMPQHPLSRFYHSCDDCAMKCQVVLISHPISVLPPTEGKTLAWYRILVGKLMLHKAARLVPSRPLPASVSACRILQNGQEMKFYYYSHIGETILCTPDLLWLSLQYISTPITCFQVKQLSTSNQGERTDPPDSNSFLR